VGLCWRAARKLGGKRAWRQNPDEPHRGCDDEAIVIGQGIEEPRSFQRTPAAS
jgi:hypothetical protein